MTEIEVAIQEEIVKAILAQFPDHGVLGEEESRGGPSLPHQPDAEWVWVIDPIDGTKEYLTTGSPFYGVGIAVLLRCGPVSAAFAAPEFDAASGRADAKGSVFEASELEPSPRVGGVGFSRRAGTGSPRRGLAIFASGTRRAFPNWEAVTPQYTRVERRARSALLAMCRTALGGPDAPELCVLGPTDIWNVVLGAYIVRKAGGTAVGRDGRELFPIHQPLLAGPSHEVPGVVAGDPVACAEFLAVAGG